MTQFIWPTTPVQLRCNKKWFETDDTISLQLTSQNQESFDFKPGQFISVGFEIEGKMEYRAYSISSMPNQDFLQLTIKRVEGGKVSNYLIEQLNEGEQVAVLAPAGPFNSIDCKPRKKVALLSAGCGITPVMSMAKTWIAQDIEVDISFIHMAKSKEQTIFFEELELLHETHANFHLKLLLKDNAETNHPQGRLDQEWLNTLCPDLIERTVYLCGPNQFMQDMKTNLENIGLDMAHFFQESFTPIEAEVSNTEDASGVVQFEVPAFGVSKEIDKGATLADVLEESGVPIIIACRSGMCGSCKCKVEKGEVSRTSTETLTEEDIDQGYALACSSQVQSDVEVSLI
ncbi:hybrid-cluster NAD(P)-dependent oxidoreductase [Aliivibrio sp. S4TY2]|uniref:hybrid-cluster NAD(P)-dependent oxidoreductase n=1 Tax=unclassified Aliivibrio TaxID=2645654 RepID=UPI0023796577|nr:MULTISPECIES: hybrid-cluster NAD(P)-dependent oxidoreductase [unclassified Aliivibrio]MDD9156205.1 hybrid-cluster NAD(P)-dependent oxidoreductase [Aliivibrio sp. S4TY2]MDD9160552.1 hybrid-cluster NAD(P)-dependent oxidoreductase [Aliivibrio sp. S4TY1]MDD9163913.1 hybrid-cluster NAD(P)-dependent oxidoreductase [Aliivibrio sp. S4MY2]MDD9168112.1 hybrid-cluster NAD(P)-dependent oxidoreductase [Aliivibrio sp. S4MY4]MDD9185109.1 hybrid-cluster NAD(P)-dependent oxidoreductase [Aliivibrio sp. S4MY3